VLHELFERILSWGYIFVLDLIQGVAYYCSNIYEISFIGRSMHNKVALIHV